MVLGNYRDFFATIAEAAATLIGLLFVAISVGQRPEAGSHAAVAREVRAAAALVAFSSALSVSLFGLIPGTNVGYPAVVVAFLGLMFTAAGMRSILASTSDPRQIRRQLGLIVVLLVTFGFELASGIMLLSDRHDNNALDTVSYVLVASLLIGVARAWELVGSRDTGIVASIAVLSGHTRSPAYPDPPAGRSTPPAGGSSPAGPVEGRSPTPPPEGGG